MKPVPFAQYLARQQQEQAEPRRSGPLAWPPRATGDDQPPEPPRRSPLLRSVEKEKQDAKPNASLRLEQAHLRAFEEGRAAARKELDDERGGLREALDAELAKARAAWAAEEGARLAQAHRAAIDSFETRCAQAVANILRPFLVRETIARVTDALVENLEAMFVARAQGIFEISGPAELLAALKEKFAAGAARMEFRPDDSLDVRVRVDETIIETQLGPWLKVLGALPRGEAQD
jgi:hypothetical protein